MKGNWIGHILCSKVLLKHTEVKTEVMGRWRWC